VSYLETGYERSGYSWIEGDITDRLVFSLDATYAAYLSSREGNEEKHTVSELFPRLWWYPRGRVAGEGSLRKGEAACCAGMMLRRERWERTGSGAGRFDKDEILPFVTASYAVSKVHLLEAGYLADRYESKRTGPGAGSDLRWENRLKLMWEIRLGERGRFRIVETIDLDREDHGQFSVHDHFFLMSRVLF
jgi:hypothetical protein